MIRRLLPSVGVLFALLTPAQRVSAASEALTYTAYTWNQAPGPETQCGDGQLSSLTLEWDSAPVPGCPSDLFYLDITGQLYNPSPATRYAIYSDDGIRVTIDGQVLVDEWWPRGCSGWVHDLQLSEGWHDIRIEYFEAGGSTCLWIIQETDGIWQNIPAAYLSTSPPATTTTQPASTTTSTIAATTTTIEATTTTYQPTVSSASPTSTATIESTIQTSTSGPPPSNPTENTSDVTTTIETTSTTTIPSSSIPETITPGISSDRAIALATSPEAVAALTVEDAAEVFAAIDEGELTPEEAAAIVAAVQNAPDEIRREFEAAVNVFSGSFDNYIPTGSRVPVSTRRIIIVTTGLLVAMPPSRRK